MESEKTDFCTYLARYGSDVTRWPEKAMALGLRLQHRPEYAVLIAQEKAFERLLRQTDEVSPAPSDLVSRILAASLSGRPAATQSPWFFLPLRSYMNPTAIAAMLMLGFAIGFNTFSSTSPNGEEAFFQFYSDDEETPL